MSVKQIVENLKKEINERNRKDAIDNLEEILSENVEELSKNEIFFHFPIKNILSVISHDYPATGSFLQRPVKKWRECVTFPHHAGSSADEKRPAELIIYRRFYTFQKPTLFFRPADTSAMPSEGPFLRNVRAPDSGLPPGAAKRPSALARRPSAPCAGL